MSLLEVKDIVLQFGGLKVIDSMNMTIEEGSIMSLIGPNGAGKTSIFNSITGFYQPNSGAINFPFEDSSKNCFCWLPPLRSISNGP